MPAFVAVDGEADDRGRYIMLCDSTGRRLVNVDGITTTQALEFLLALAGERVVCFGLNYDANQWLADLSEPELRRLVDTNHSAHRNRYKLYWLPTVYFTCKDARTARYVKVCEVFKFFQCSFVVALKRWGLEPPAEIVTMKKRRGTFTSRELDRIADYCLTECRLLVELMTRLAAACDDAGCAPRRDWIGAGAIASSLLHAHDVKDHHAYDADLADRQVVDELILGAYFGARVELLAQGELAAPAQTADIRSAYPHAATALPSLDGARIVRRRKFRPEARHAIWHVRWTDQCHGRLAPFPVRAPDRSIHYPISGAGTYHHAEVLNALALGYELEIGDGVELVPRNGARPFDWIPRLFAHRARLQQRGDPAEKALKLGLNAVYGKLAQGYGVSRPAFQSYWWAGEITAATRARMLAAAHRAKAPLMIATDGLFCLRSRQRGARKLGGWELGELRDLLCLQAGVYEAFHDDGSPLVRSRGFFARDVDYAELRAGWRARGHEYTHHYRSRRFLGLRIALHRNDLSLWRRWVDEPRQINLHPERKLIRHDSLHDAATGMIALHPPAGPLESVPYLPKVSLYDDPTDQALEAMVADDQPHHEGS